MKMVFSLTKNEKKNCLWDGMLQLNFSQMIKEENNQDRRSATFFNTEQPIARRLPTMNILYHNKTWRKVSSMIVFDS